MFYVQSIAGLISVFPEAEGELGEIGSMLSGLMIEASQGSETTLNFGPVNEDASKILAEAATCCRAEDKGQVPRSAPRNARSLTNREIDTRASKISGKQKTCLTPIFFFMNINLAYL